MAGVRILVQFTADSPAAAEERVNTMLERARKTEAEEKGCVQYEVFRSAMRPTQFALLEHWESQEALDEHRKLLQARSGGPPPSGGSITNTFELYEHKEGRF